MSVRKKVLEILKDQLGVKEEELKGDAELVKGLGADDLDSVEIVMSLEEEFGVEITDNEADSWVFVRDVVNFIEKKVGEK